MTFTWKRSSIKPRKHGTLMCTDPILSTCKLLLFVQHWTRLYEVHKKKLRSIILHLNCIIWYIINHQREEYRAQLGTSGHIWMDGFPGSSLGHASWFFSILYTLISHLSPSCFYLIIISSQSILSFIWEVGPFLSNSFPGLHLAWTTFQVFHRSFLF